MDPVSVGRKCLVLGVKKKRSPWCSRDSNTGQHEPQQGRASCTGLASSYVVCDRGHYCWFVENVLRVSRLLWVCSRSDGLWPTFTVWIKGSGLETMSPSVQWLSWWLETCETSNTLKEIFVVGTNPKYPTVLCLMDRCLCFINIGCLNIMSSFLFELSIHIYNLSHDGPMIQNFHWIHIAHPLEIHKMILTFETLK